MIFKNKSKKNKNKFIKKTFSNKQIGSSTSVLEPQSHDFFKYVPSKSDRPNLEYLRSAMTPKKSFITTKKTKNLSNIVKNNSNIKKNISNYIWKEQDPYKNFVKDYGVNELKKFIIISDYPNGKPSYKSFSEKMFNFLRIYIPKCYSDSELPNVFKNNRKNIPKSLEKVNSINDIKYLSELFVLYLKFGIFADVWLSNSTESFNMKTNHIGGAQIHKAIISITDIANNFISKCLDKKYFPITDNTNKIIPYLANPEEYGKHIWNDFDYFINFFYMLKKFYNKGQNKEIAQEGCADALLINWKNTDNTWKDWVSENEPRKLNEHETDIPTEDEIYIYNLSIELSNNPGDLRDYFKTIQPILKIFIYYLALTKISNSVKIAPRRENKVLLKLYDKEGHFEPDNTGRLLGSMILDNLHDFYFTRGSNWYPAEKSKSKIKMDYPETFDTFTKLYEFLFNSPEYKKGEEPTLNNYNHIIDAIKAYYVKVEIEQDAPYTLNKELDELPSKTVRGQSMDSVHYDALFTTHLDEKIPSLSGFHYFNPNIPNLSKENNGFIQQLFGGGKWFPVNGLFETGITFDQANDPTAGFLINEIPIIYNLPNLCDPGEGFREAFHVNEIMDSLVNEIEVPNTQIIIDPSSFKFIIEYAPGAELLTVNIDIENEGFPNITMTGPLFWKGKYPSHGDYLLNAMCSLSTISNCFDEWNNLLNSHSQETINIHKNRFKGALLSKLYGDFGQILSCLCPIGTYHGNSPSINLKTKNSLFLSGDTSALSLAAMVEYLSRNDGIYVSCTKIPELTIRGEVSIKEYNEMLSEDYIETNPKLRIISLKQKDYSSINFPLKNNRDLDIIKDYIKNITNLSSKCEICELFISDNHNHINNIDELNNTKLLLKEAIDSDNHDNIITYTDKLLKDQKPYGNTLNQLINLDEYDIDKVMIKKEPIHVISDIENDNEDIVSDSQVDIESEIDNEPNDRFKKICKKCNGNLSYYQGKWWHVTRSGRTIHNKDQICDMDKRARIYTK